MSPALAEQEMKANGEMHLDQAGLRVFFDRQARAHLGISGEVALRQIRSGRAGSNLAWTELALLSTLFVDE